MAELFCIFLFVSYHASEALPCVCMENTAQGGGVEKFIQHEALAECCMTLRTPTRVLCFSYKYRQCFNCYIVLLDCLARRDFVLLAKFAANFGDQDNSKCLNKLFLVVDQLIG